jgi:hypothetical protein
MELLLHRQIRTDNSTIGTLYVNNEFECYTLEDKDRGLHSDMPLPVIQRNKVYGKTCIPSGRYEVTQSFSGLFKKVMPLVNGVKGYEYIRIHPGNKKEDTLGCILTGTSYDTDMVRNSRVAFDALYKKMQKAFSQKEKVFITIN